MNENREIDTAERSRSRRRFLAIGAGGAGALAAAGLAGASVGGAMGDDDNERFVVEAAMRGDTLRVLLVPVLSPAAGVSEGDVRGSTFWLEGWLYPEGTIPDGDGFVPVPDGNVGIITCRGHLLTSPERVEPHLITHQEYHFGSFDEPVFGTRMLTSQGFEGRDEAGWQSLRAVNGGTGVYRGARGEVLQTMTGSNATTDLRGVPLPNFRFEFDIDLP